MNLFGTTKPRGFHHEYIYVDERKEQLQKIEQRARRELGIDTHCNSMDEKQKIGRNNSRYQFRHDKRTMNRVAFGGVWVVALLVILLVILCFFVLYV